MRKRGEMDARTLSDQIVSRGTHRQAIGTGLPDELVVMSHDPTQCVKQDAMFCCTLLEALDRYGIPTPYIGPSDEGGVRVLFAQKLGAVQVLAVGPWALCHLDTRELRVNLIECENPEARELARKTFAVLSDFFGQRGLMLIEARFGLGLGPTIASDRERLLVFGLIGPEDLTVLDGLKEVGDLLALF